MNLDIAKHLAITLLVEHNLYHWSFKWHHAKTIYGTCYHHRHQIALSKPLTEKDDESHVRDTILHEIAHALVGSGHGHDATWKRQARAIGCSATRTTSSKVDIKPKYKAKCKGCGMIHKAHRKVKRNHWCKCDNRNFNPTMQLVYVQQY